HFANKNDLDFESVFFLLRRDIRQYYQRRITQLQRNTSIWRMGMRKLSCIITLFAGAAILLVSSGYSQDTQPPAKAQLPAGWGKLGITADQKKKILEVMGSYQSKIAALKDQMDKLKASEYSEAFKLLNDDQKATLKKLATEKADPTTKDKTDDKKKG